MFLVGEFSKISRVSKRLLHYYDDIGLFKPAHTDSATGYRYYSAKQLPHLNRILALKDLGLSLEQITNMLQAKISDEEIHGMWMMKKAEMEQTVLEDLQRLRRIEARLNQNQTVDDPPDIVVKSIPPQQYLSVRTKVSSEEETLQLVEQILHAVPTKVRSGVLGPFACVVYTDDFILTNHEIDLGYLLKSNIPKPVLLTEEYILRSQELPAVETMATVVQTGGVDPVLVALGKIAQWIEANGYQIAGLYREIGFDVSRIDDFENAVYEIQMPIKNVTPASNLKFKFLD